MKKQRKGKKIGLEKNRSSQEQKLWFVHVGVDSCELVICHDCRFRGVIGTVIIENL